MPDFKLIYKGGDHFSKGFRLQNPADIRKLQIAIDHNATMYIHIFHK